MELWIRSQNKETLIKCEKILVEKGKDSFTLLNYIDTKNWFRLGNYKTKERALEVLDEIDERICLLRTLELAKGSSEILKGIEKALGEDKLKGLNYPYQMPKE